MRLRLWSILLAAAVLLPSLEASVKFLGLPATAVYGALCLVYGPAAAAWFASRRPARLGRRTAALAAAGAMAVLAGAFFVVFPIANSGQMGAGSDRDEALSLAIQAMLSGQFPYYEQTYFGNPITPLPGSLILGVPFHLAGNVALQNIFWTALLLVEMAKILKSTAQSAVLVTGLMLSLTNLREFLVGGDYLANAIYVLVFSLGLIHSWQVLGPRSWRPLIWAAAFGIALSSRLSFLMVAPVLFGAWAATSGWRKAVAPAAIGALAFLAVTLPFYLMDPANFSPLHTSQKLGDFDAIVPGIGMIIPVATMALAIFAGARTQSGKRSQFLLWSSVVMAAPIVAATILDSVQAGELSLRYVAYGAVAGMFALAGGALALREPALEEAAAIPGPQPSPAEESTAAVGVR